MTSKLLFITLLAVLLLGNVKGEDDFKEEDSVENVELEPKEDEIDEVGAERPARLFRTGRFRFSGRRTSGGGTSGSRGGFFSRRSSTGGGSSTRRGFFSRRSSTGGGGSTRRGFFTRRSTTTRRTNTGGGGTGGSTGLSTIGTILEIGQLGADIASTVLTAIGKVERKIVVGLGNLGELDWEAGTVFMDVGSSLKSLPLEVSRDEGLQLAGVKPTGINTQGVAGCICYKFKFIPRSFCIMFKVPYSGDNYWNIKVYSGTKRADKATFDELVSSSPFKAGTPVGEKQISDGVFIKDASMTTSGQSILTILVGISS